MTITRGLGRYHRHDRDGIPFFVHRHDGDAGDHSHTTFVWATEQAGRTLLTDEPPVRTPGEATPAEDALVGRVTN